MVTTQLLVIIMTNRFGTTEYYKEMFADLIADVQHDSPVTGDNLVEAFKLAIAEWREYHAEQVNELDRISKQLDKPGDINAQSWTYLDYPWGWATH